MSYQEQAIPILLLPAEEQYDSAVRQGGQTSQPHSVSKLSIKVCNAAEENTTEQK